MADVNTVVIQGRLGKDPDLKATPGGDSICSFSIANSSYKQVNGEWVEDTSWFDVTLFGDIAERFVERPVLKGHRVIITGNLKQRTWKDKDGNKRERVGIIGRSVSYLEKKKKQAETSEPTPEPAARADVPFLWDGGPDYEQRRRHVSRW